MIDRQFQETKREFSKEPLDALDAYVRIAQRSGRLKEIYQELQEPDFIARIHTEPALAERTFHIFGKRLREGIDIAESRRFVDLTLDAVVAQMPYKPIPEFGDIMRAYFNSIHAVPADFKALATLYKDPEQLRLPRVAEHFEEQGIYLGSEGADLGNATHVFELYRLYLKTHPAQVTPAQLASFTELYNATNDFESVALFASAVAQESGRRTAIYTGHHSFAASETDGIDWIVSVYEVHDNLGSSRKNGKLILINPGPEPQITGLNKLQIERGTPVITDSDVDEAKPWDMGYSVHLNGDRIRVNQKLAGGFENWIVAKPEEISKLIRMLEDPMANFEEVQELYTDLAFESLSEEEDE